VLPLLPVFEKNFLTFFNAEAICILDPFSFQPGDTCRLNRYAFTESFSPFAWQRFPQTESSGLF
jgi:hypothetical protein